MKNCAIVLCIMLIAISGAGPVLGVDAYSQGVNVYATLLNQDPNPAEAGSSVDVRFKVQNWGNAPAENVTVELLPEFPFSLAGGESAIRNIGSMSALQKEEESAVIKYSLIVDPSAVEGVNSLKLRYRLGRTQGWIEPAKYSIDVGTSDALVGVVSMKTEPELISPGERATVKITVQNKATSLVRNLKVKLDLTSTIPLAPTDSSNEKVISALTGGEVADIEFHLIAEPDAASGVYKVPLAISFKDRLGTEYESDTIVGLVVGDEPELIMLVASSEITYPESSGKVLIKVVNQGLSDIKFLTASLGKSPDFELLSPDKVYIGKISSDDYETAEYKLFAHTPKDLKVMLPITITYRDSSNREYSFSENVALQLYSKQQAEQLGLAKGNAILGIVVVLVIIGVGIYVYRKRRKK